MSNGYSPDIIDSLIKKQLHKNLSDPLVKIKESLEYVSTEFGDKFPLTLKPDMKNMAR